ncbi:MAG: phosphatidylglycerol lysyltransferase domain-containing protein [Desulfobulbaceae bacterium]|nr:phosphatidylglycerol lysyltransferase domain-containing protein [Desulfobulbaceae bacterium]
MDLTFTPITLDRQDEYLTLLRTTPQVSSDYSFLNLWAWADEHDLTWAWDDGLVWIRQSKPTLTYWAPVGPWNSIDWQQLMPKLQGLPYSRLPEPLAVLMARAHPQAQIKTSREHWDYLYSVPDLIQLPGNKFHAKQNLLKQFHKGYIWRYQPMDEELVEMVLLMQSQWCAWRDCESSVELAAEDRVISKVLHAFSDFPNLTGGALLVDSQVVAFTIAEPLQPDTILIHFEKGMGIYKGVYQAINHEFLAAQSGFSLVNREQDLGNEGLRRAKLSYHPIHFIRKYELLWF